MSRRRYACMVEPALFDSTDADDHLEAARLCHVCPIMAACQADAVRQYLAAKAGARLAGQRFRPAEGTIGGVLWTHDALGIPVGDVRQSERLG